MRLAVVFLAPFLLAGQGNVQIERLSFMSGCWQSRAASMLIEEVWTRPAGDTLLGISRTTKGGRTAFSEFMRIERQAGNLVYVARIEATSGNPVPFTLIRSSDDEAVFENAAHDFPQRIIYRRISDGLAARVEGTDKGKPRSEDFAMKPDRCGSAPGL